MKQCYIQNLSMIITNKCNLDCKHCLSVKKNNQTMSNGIIEATLDQVKGVGNLAINGGEITLVIDRNVLDESIQEVCIRNVDKILKPGQFERVAYRTLKNY